MFRTSLLMIAVILAVGVFVPQLGILLLVALLLIGIVGLLLSSSNPFDRRRRGGWR